MPKNAANQLNNEEVQREKLYTYTANDDQPKDDKDKDKRKNRRQHRNHHHKHRHREDEEPSDLISEVTSRPGSPTTATPPTLPTPPTPPTSSTSPTTPTPSTPPIPPTPPKPPTPPTTSKTTARRRRHRSQRKSRAERRAERRSRRKAADRAAKASSSREADPLVLAELTRRYSHVLRPFNVGEGKHEEKAADAARSAYYDNEAVRRIYRRYFLTPPPPPSLYPIVVLLSEKATIEKANLEKAKLEKANLEKANIEKANIEKASVEKATIDKASNEEAINKEASNEKASNEEASNERPSNEQSSNEKGCIEKGSNNAKESNEKGSNEEASIEKGTDEKASDEKGSTEKANNNNCSDSINKNDAGAQNGAALPFDLRRVLCGTPRLEAEAAALLAKSSLKSPFAPKRRGRVKGRVYKRGGRRPRRNGANQAKQALQREAAAERLKQEQQEAEAEQQLKQNRTDAAKQRRAASTRCAVAAHLDPDVLNHIETLEYVEEVENAGGKRKRARNNSDDLAHVCSHRKRIALHPDLVDDSPASDCRPVESATPVASAPSYSAPPRVLRLRRTRYNSTGTGNNSGINNNAKSTGRGKKNNKNTSANNPDMSLYERRYQNEEGGGGSRGIVTNGYVGSGSARNNSLTAGQTAHGDIGVGSGGDSQDAAYITSGGVGVNASSALSLGNGSAQPLNNATAMATLCNIGNTCYLNSVVYTLRFAPRFLHNLHHLVSDVIVLRDIFKARIEAAKSGSLGRTTSSAPPENSRSWSSKDLIALEQCIAAGGVNKVGRVGGGSSGSSTGGGGGGGTKSSSSSPSQPKTGHLSVSERLHELYQCLHRNEIIASNDPFHADTLLSAIQEVSSIFEGNQQQDAHEFLMCLLNSIRETCQTLMKAITDWPELVAKGYVSNPDEIDSSTPANDKAVVPSGNSHVPANNSALLSLSSSLSTNKASFFSRKSKRKDEAKASKSSRLQSPLKEGGVSVSVAGGSLIQPQPQSNSFFYLNTVDISVSDGNATNGGGTASAPSTALALKSAHLGGGDVSAPMGSKEWVADRIRDLGLHFFSDDFEGVTVSSTKCLSCETITEQKETMIDIAVPVPISGYESTDLAETPGSFIQNSAITREYFRGENKYRCEQCTGYTEAIRSISYEVLPRLLVIQLSRFSGGMEKINSYIPTSFTLQCFCTKCCELGDDNKLHVYKLYSVITHVGATMSVGHYIAYTCSLDSAQEYKNCPKDKHKPKDKKKKKQQQALTAGGGMSSAVGGTSGNTSSSSAAASAAASALASGTSLMKKMKFGRSKASSSGDMSKHLKSLNGVTSKSITNGMGKMSMNTNTKTKTNSEENASCSSLVCCATQLNGSQQAHLELEQRISNSGSDLSEESLQNGANSTATSNSNAGNYPFGYGSTGRGGVYRHASYNATASGDPIWYMCDDDKIKAMSQREFEELLSPSRKITVTPYLLFYARFDLQPTSASTSASSSQGGKAQMSATTPSTSWSNESLQMGGATQAAATQHKM